MPRCRDPGEVRQSYLDVICASLDTLQPLVQNSRGASAACEHEVRIREEDNISQSPESQDMDVFQSVSGYVTKMVSAGDGATTGGAAKMKGLLLDQDTVPIVSSATTQSALLNHSVYLTERIDNVEREKMRHLRCLCFMRPSSESIQFLIDELREPKYGEYHICTCRGPLRTGDRILTDTRLQQHHKEVLPRAISRSR